MLAVERAVPSPSPQAGERGSETDSALGPVAPRSSRRRRGHPGDCGAQRNSAAGEEAARLRILPAAAAPHPAPGSGGAGGEAGREGRVAWVMAAL